MSNTKALDRNAVNIIQHAIDVSKSSEKHKPKHQSVNFLDVNRLKHFISSIF